MIVTRTPLRVSFFGGGSDIPEFYEKYGEGICISTTINSYIYLAVNRCVASHLRVIYSELEQVEKVDDIKHDRVREALKYWGIESNIEICSFSDMPTKGTGLGSSSTFTVGLMNALSRIASNDELGRWSLADLACHIEIDKCKQGIGKQDQYAAAYGGLNRYTFTPTGVYVDPVQVTRYTSHALNSNLLFFNTNITRDATAVLAPQIESLKNDDKAVGYTKKLVDMARTGTKLLEDNKLNDFGALLGQSWEIKRNMSPGVSTQLIDEMYDECIVNGALGGKLLGAGGGGYLMMYVPNHHKKAVIEAMDKMGSKPSQFLFTHTGSTIDGKWN